MRAKRKRGVGFCRTLNNAAKRLNTNSMPSIFKCDDCGFKTPNIKTFSRHLARCAKKTALAKRAEVKQAMIARNDPTGRLKRLIDSNERSGRAGALQILDGVLSETNVKSRLRDAMREALIIAPLETFERLIMPLMPKSAIADLFSVNEQAADINVIITTKSEHTEKRQSKRIASDASHVTTHEIIDTRDDAEIQDDLLDTDDASVASLKFPIDIDKRGLANG